MKTIEIKKMAYHRLLEYANKLQIRNNELENENKELKNRNLNPLLINKIKILHKNVEYRKQCSEKIKKFKKQHVFQHLSKSYVRQGIMLTPMDLWSMAKKQKGLCGISGTKLKGHIISLDHIIPKTRGGSDDKTNLRLARLDVNIKKKNSTDEEFFQLCKNIVNFNKLN